MNHSDDEKWIKRLNDMPQINRDLLAKQKQLNGILRYEQKRAHKERNQQMFRKGTYAVALILAPILLFLIFFATDDLNFDDGPASSDESEESSFHGSVHVEFDPDMGQPFDEEGLSEADLERIESVREGEGRRMHGEYPLVVLSTNQVVDVNKETVVIDSDITEQMWRKMGWSGTPVSLLSPAYSPDKKAIRVTVRHQNEDSVYYAPADFNVEEGVFSTVSDGFEMHSSFAHIETVWSPDGNQIAMNMLTGYSGEHTYFAFHLKEKGDVEELILTNRALPNPLNDFTKDASYSFLIYDAGSLQWSDAREAFKVDIHSRRVIAPDRTYTMDFERNRVYVYRYTAWFLYGALILLTGAGLVFLKKKIQKG